MAAHAARDAGAIRIFHTRHPRFLDSEVKWLPRPITDSEIGDAILDSRDGQLAVARWYDFQDWAALEQFVAAVAQDSAVQVFETAVEAVIDGDVDALKGLVATHPELVRGGNRATVIRGWCGA